MAARTGSLPLPARTLSRNRSAGTCARSCATAGANASGATASKARNVARRAAVRPRRARSAARARLRGSTTGEALTGAALSSAALPCAALSCSALSGAALPGTTLARRCLRQPARSGGRSAANATRAAAANSACAAASDTKARAAGTRAARRLLTAGWRRLAGAAQNEFAGLGVGQGRVGRRRGPGRGIAAGAGRAGGGRATRGTWTRRRCIRAAGSAALEMLGDELAPEQLLQPGEAAVGAALGAGGEGEGPVRTPARHLPRQFLPEEGGGARALAGIHRVERRRSSPASTAAPDDLAAVDVVRPAVIAAARRRPLAGAEIAQIGASHAGGRRVGLDVGRLRRRPVEGHRAVDLVHLRERRRRRRAEGDAAQQDLSQSAIDARHGEPRFTAS